MTAEFVTTLFRWFDDYTRPYLADGDTAARTCGLKYHHTLRVVDEMDALLASLTLPDRDVQLARVIALLHDLGRFEQMRRWGTLADRRSTDHAALGVAEIDRAGVLNSLSDEDRQLIRTAVAVHNRLAIPTDLTERERLFAHLIRDADKLDILRVFVQQDESADEDQRRKAYLDVDEIDLVNEGVLADIEARRMVRLEHCRSRHDIRLLMLSWVFDFNFTHSLRRVAERNETHRLLKVLPDDPRTRNACRIIEDMLRSAPATAEVRQAS